MTGSLLKQKSILQRKHLMKRVVLFSQRERYLLRFMERELSVRRLALE